jgi:hypothetical protein
MANSTSATGGVLEEAAEPAGKLTERRRMDRVVGKNFRMDFRI